MNVSGFHFDTSVVNMKDYDQVCVYNTCTLCHVKRRWMQLTRQRVVLAGQP